MNLTSHVQFLEELEARFPVDRWRVGQLHVWPLVRYRVSVDNLALVNRTREPSDPLVGRARQLLRNEKGWLGAELQDSNHSSPIARRADVLLYADGVSQLFAGGVWHNRFSDPLAVRAEALGLTTSTWMPLNRFCIPRARQSAFVQPLLDAHGVFCKATHRLGPQAELEGYEDFKAFVLGRFPGARLPSAADIRKAAYYVDQHSRLYRALLQRIRPKVCFIVSYYGTERSSFVRACRQLGIPAVDVQHGYAGAQHWAYSGWTRVPAGGFDLLPEVFWRWGEDDKAVIDAWASKTAGAHRAEVVGNIFLSAWWQRQFPSIDEATRRAGAVRARARGRTNMLFTLNGFETPDMLDRLAAMFRRESANTFFWLRTHPSRGSQRQALLSRLAGFVPNDVSIDEATELPLPVVLESIDVHLTEISTTVVEAELYGVPSVILGDERSVIYAAQVASGVARVAHTIDEIPRVAAELKLRPRADEACFARPYDRQLLSLAAR